MALYLHGDWFSCLWLHGIRTAYGLLERMHERLGNIISFICVQESRERGSKDPQVGPRHAMNGVSTCTHEVWRGAHDVTVCTSSRPALALRYTLWGGPLRCCNGG